MGAGREEHSGDLLGHGGKGRDGFTLRKEAEGEPGGGDRGLSAPRSRSFQDLEPLQTLDIPTCALCELAPSESDCFLPILRVGKPRQRKSPLPAEPGATAGPFVSSECAL